ncbi:DNA-processing protein DprA [Sphingopyxis alaskensis]|jgi:DNA processing protein|uniref:DNA processing protein DprA, putative n=1 Tax=Sphingopyxis alaskensis (strain DSM 13593 / LMG 18877 / RB2256) TaxID=317655 RepID=Q1GTU7_SPHAL|nr:DNA-processing protein DprA [Sphingopyxis alaskensis]ABF52925.1 DNA processing protein DprA, putative [Sphingopyxis alaskensis RB2256]MCM3419632.1 DNA-processing protein DprA [Sphingopyxis alaskensis]
MKDAERLARLRLIRTPHVGPVSWHQLMERFGSGEAALDALPDLVLRGGAGKARIAPAEVAEREIERVAALGARHIFSDEDEYSPLLRDVEGAPPVIVVRGDTAMLHRPCVAIVGARNASAIACRFARQIAADLAEKGVTVVSGLARGVDTAAHVGALGGATAGVIASGIDIAFPPENAALQERIAADQLLIAEQPPGTEPLARHFPSRNRIIAGLAHGTLVIEAAPKSGSLITARRAGDYGREVMAVPGSPLDPRAQGCNQLIRDGATLIQTADEVIEAIGPIDRRMVREPVRAFFVPPVTEPANDERQALVDLLGPTPVTVDELVRQSGQDAAAVQLVLLELELAGRIERHAGAKISLL